MIYFTNQCLKRKTRSSNNSKDLVLEQTLGHTNSSSYFHWHLSSTVWNSDSKENSSGQTTRSYLSGIYNFTFSSFLDEKIVCLLIFSLSPFTTLKKAIECFKTNFSRYSVSLFPWFFQGSFFRRGTSVLL